MPPPRHPARERSGAEKDAEMHVQKPVEVAGLVLDAIQQDDGHDASMRKSNKRRWHRPLSNIGYAFGRRSRILVP